MYIYIYIYMCVSIEMVFMFISCVGVMWFIVCNVKTQMEGRGRGGTERAK